MWLLDNTYSCSSPGLPVFPKPLQFILYACSTAQMRIPAASRQCHSSQSKENPTHNPNNTSSGLLIRTTDITVHDCHKRGTEHSTRKLSCSYRSMIIEQMSVSGKAAETETAQIYCLKHIAREQHLCTIRC